MINEDKRFREYYITNKYNGFHKLREQNYKLSFSTHLTFSNGEKEIFASGYFKEEALKRIFDKIDKFHSDEENPTELKYRTAPFSIWRQPVSE